MRARASRTLFALALAVISHSSTSLLLGFAPKQNSRLCRTSQKFILCRRSSFVWALVHFYVQASASFFCCMCARIILHCRPCRERTMLSELNCVSCQARHVVHDFFVGAFLGFFWEAPAPPDRPGRLGEGMHFEKHTTQQMPGLLGRRIGPAGATKYCGVRYNRLMRIDRSDCFGPSHAKSAARAFGATGRLGVWGHCWAISPFMLATSEASKSPSERLTWLKCRTCLFFLRGRGCSPPPERYKYLF